MRSAHWCVLGVAALFCLATACGRQSPLSEMLLPVGHPIAKAVERGDIAALEAAAVTTDLAKVRIGGDVHATPLLHMAPDRKTAAFLLDHGASLDAASSSGTKPLHAAASFGYLDLLDFYIERGVPIDQPTGEDSFSISQMRHFNPEDAPPEISGRIYGGLTALHLGRPESIEHLVALGADVDVEGPHGLTPLHAACLQGATKTVETLLRLGANRHATSDSGMTTWDFLHFGKGNFGRDEDIPKIEALLNAE